MNDTTLTIGKKEFHSRLLVGTGKYPSLELMQEALSASGAEVITVALRRMNLDELGKKTILDYIDRKKYTILPNTAACFTVEEALRTARLGRELGLSDMVKLEVIGDQKTLMPDTWGLLEATKILVKEGFMVMPYTNDDVVVAKRLVDAGACCIMPLASPIGSGQGILNRLALELIREAITIPMIVDAGVGTASDAAIAMELGADGVLMNTGIACAKEPVSMACAMKKAVEAGRLSYLSGRIPKKRYATASSPDEGKL